MGENESDVWVVPKWLRFIIFGFLGIIALFVGVVLCGLIALRISIDSNYGRAYRVGDEIIEYIEPVYDQVQESVLDETMLIETQEPISGTFAFGLSDGSKQYASASAHQIYTSLANLDQIAPIYERMFIESDWVSVPLSGWEDRITIAFHHPREDYLIGGICEAQEPSEQSEKFTYTVYFFYSEVGCRNEMSMGDSLYCVANYFCRE